MFERYYKAQRARRKLPLTSVSDSHKVVDNLSLLTIFTGSWDDCCKFQRAYGHCTVALN